MCTEQELSEPVFLGLWTSLLEFGLLVFLIRLFEWNVKWNRWPWFFPLPAWPTTVIRLLVSHSQNQSFILSHSICHEEICAYEAHGLCQGFQRFPPQWIGLMETSHIVPSSCQSPKHHGDLELSLIKGDDNSSFLCWQLHKTHLMQFNRETLPLTI